MSGSVNPYLGMAAFIAAGLDGIQRKLDPGEPNTGRNMYTLTLDEVKQRGLELIPQSLPEAIAALRETRRQSPTASLISLSGADPLNLVGILTPGPKLAALTVNRLLYRDGVPIALLAGGEVQFLETLEPAEEWQAHKALLRVGPTLSADGEPGEASAPALRP